MNLLLIIFGILVLLFGFVLLYGAPYLPTLKKQTDTVFDMLQLQQGQTLLELGCGDGRVLAAAAKRGFNAVGYELNPILVVVAKLRCLPYRRQTKVIWKNYWRVEWPKAQAIYVFLLDKYMAKLDKKVIQYPHRSVKLASFAFQIPGKKPTAVKDGIYLYNYTK